MLRFDLSSYAPLQGPDHADSAGPRRPSILLSYDLDTAVRQALVVLRGNGAIGDRPSPPQPPGHDVHFGVESAETTIAEWRRGITATAQLAAAVRGLLPPAGAQRSDAEAALEAALDAADVAVRAVPGPPATPPGKDQADRLQLVRGDLGRFWQAAGALGRAGAGILEAAHEQWNEAITDVSALPAQARELLPAAGQPLADRAAALDRLDAAVAAVPRPPTVLPSTAAEVTATIRTVAEYRARQRDVTDRWAEVLTSAVEGWDSRLANARSLAGAARRIGRGHDSLLAALDSAEAPLTPADGSVVSPPRPALPLSTEQGMNDARAALAGLTAFEEATRAVLAATDLNGLQADVAAAGPDRGGPADAALHRPAASRPDGPTGPCGRPAGPGQARLVASERGRAGHRGGHRCDRSRAGRWRGGRGREGTGGPARGPGRRGRRGERGRRRPHAPG